MSAHRVRIDEVLESALDQGDRVAEENRLARKPVAQDRVRLLKFRVGSPRNNLFRHVGEFGEKRDQLRQLHPGSLDRHGLIAPHALIGDGLEFLEQLIHRLTIHDLHLGVHRQRGRRRDHEFGQARLIAGVPLVAVVKITLHPRPHILFEIGIVRHADDSIADLLGKAVDEEPFFRPAFLRVQVHAIRHGRHRVNVTRRIDDGRRRQDDLALALDRSSRLVFRRRTLDQVQVRFVEEDRGVVITVGGVFLAVLQEHRIGHHVGSLKDVRGVVRTLVVAQVRRDLFGEVTE